MVQLPHWLTHRGIRSTIIDDMTIRLQGPGVPECEVAVYPMPAGPGFKVSVDFDHEDGRNSQMITETPFNSVDTAWQAGFELLKKRLGLTA